MRHDLSGFSNKSSQEISSIIKYGPDPLFGNSTHADGEPILSVVIGAEQRLCVATAG